MTRWLAGAQRGCSCAQRPCGRARRRTRADANDRLDSQLSLARLLLANERPVARSRREEILALTESVGTTADVLNARINLGLGRIHAGDAAGRMEISRRPSSRRCRRTRTSRLAPTTTSPRISALCGELRRCSGAPPRGPRACAAPGELTRPVAPRRVPVRRLQRRRLGLPRSKGRGPTSPSRPARGTWTSPRMRCWRRSPRPGATTTLRGRRRRPMLEHARETGDPQALWPCQGLAARVALDTGRRAEAASLVDELAREYADAESFVVDLGFIEGSVAADALTGPRSSGIISRRRPPSRAPGWTLVRPSERGGARRRPTCSRPAERVRSCGPRPTHSSRASRPRDARSARSGGVLRERRRDRVPRPCGIAPAGECLSRRLARMIVCSQCGRESPDDGALLCLVRDGARAAVRREERKVVTVVFADLVGSTARAERLDPEDVRAMLSPYHARLRRELERHGGTVEKFIGDAVVGRVRRSDRSRGRSGAGGARGARDPGGDRGAERSGAGARARKSGSASTPERHSSHSMPLRLRAREWSPVT